MSIFKKFTAVLLVVSFIICVSPVTALANKQSPVGNLTITAINTPRTGNVYRLRLAWTRPLQSSNSDGASGSTLHGIDGYRIAYRDVTANANNNTWIPIDNNFQSDASGPSLEVSIELLPARIYEFRVRPYHIHRVAIGVDPQTGDTIWGNVEAAIDDDPAFPDQRVLFFSDLVVDKPEGAGSEITVSWLAPRFANQRVFNQYRIYWTTDTREPMQLGNSGVFTSPVIDVRTQGTLDYRIAETVENGSLRYTCTFRSNDLDINKDYTLVVEPWVGGQRWRDSSAQIGQMAPNPNPDLFRIDTRPPDASRNGRYVFQHTPRETREYRSSQFRLRLVLERVLNENDNEVRIHWNPRYIGEGDRPIYIYMSRSEDGVGQQIGFLGAGSRDINFWITEKPDDKAWYYITLGRPEEELSSDDKKSRPEPYDPKAAEFTPYSPDILQLTRQIEGVIPSFELTWKAFIRDIYNSGRENDSPNRVKDEFGRDKILDTDVHYEIYIADSTDELNGPRIEGIAFVDVGAANAKQHPEPSEPSDPWTWAYSIRINSYYDGALQTHAPLALNKIYYVKVVARRGDYITEPVYSSIYLPGDVMTAPQMMARPPLRLGPREAERDAIYISWRTKWNEVYNDHSNLQFGNTAFPEGWYSLVGWNGSKYAFGMAETDTRMYDLSDPADYISFQNSIDNPLLPKREIDVTGSDFEIYVTEFDNVLNFGSSNDPATAAEEFLQSINKGVEWQMFKRGELTIEEYLNEKITDSVAVGQIQKNTAYVVFFRPVGADGKAASYPSYVTCVTPNDQNELNVTPVVPQLEIDRQATAAQRVTVYWEMSSELQYTLAYSEWMSQYPDGGTRISFSDISQNGSIRVIDGKQYWFYEIDGLFGMTEYYFWIRSEVRPPTSIPPSSWSNPISETTQDVDAPLPPRGLGLASRDLIDEYNAQFSAELRPIGGNYMVLQWMRDYNDTTNEGTFTTNGDVARLDPQALPEHSYMVRFGSLIANRDYHIRAKTIFTMLRTGGTVKIQYSYLVQLADNEDFIDALEIYIPALDLQPVLKRDMIRKESDWTTVLRIKTSTSSDDYDSEWDERMYPLPASDFEITYHSTTGELKYRFRSMLVAEDGTHDNSVDQRFISRMIRDRVYIYELDLTNYMGNNVRKRTLEIPYSIVRAMDERNVRLRFIADNLTLTIAPKSLLTAEVNGLGDFGSFRTAVRYSLLQNPPGIPARMVGEEYASVPHRLSVTIDTPTRTLNLANLAQDIEVSMKIGAQYTPQGRNINTCYTDQNAAEWSPVSSKYNNVAGTMTFPTKRVGVYSAIARPMPIMIGNGTLSDGAYTLLTRLSITDLRSFNPHQPINASQLNNIVAAIAQNRPSVAINENMSTADYQSLMRSGILVTGMEVTREAGIHALVRLYELKTDASVQNFGTVSETPYLDIATANSQYQQSLLKAAKLGFFNKLTTNPSGLLTMNDAFEMFAYMIEDAGL